jgi:hypothetical protein
MQNMPDSERTKHKVKIEGFQRYLTQIRPEVQQHSRRALFDGRDNNEPTSGSGFGNEGCVRTYACIAFACLYWQATVDGQTCSSFFENKIISQTTKEDGRRVTSRQ